MQLRDRNRIALLAAFALAIHSIESLVPTPIPWIRLGFANIITLVTLMLYGLYPAVMVTLIRVVLGSLFAGSFLGPGFLLSLGGGVASILSMGIIFMTFPRLFSGSPVPPLGCGVRGEVA